MNLILKNIFSLLERKGKMQKDLADYLGVNAQATTSWKNGRTQSYMKYLPKIAEYLEVPVEELTGENAALHTSKLTDQEETLLVIFRSISEEGRMRVVQAVMNIRDDDAQKNVATSHAG